MDKSILSLILIGIALAVVHIPSMTIMLGIITFLVIAAIKLFWSILEPYSQPAAQRVRVQKTRETQAAELC